MIWLRRILKILHTVSSCGLIGGLLAYMVILITAPQATPSSYADMRVTIAANSNHVLLPSLAVALISGLLAMAAHRPDTEKVWAWIKAATGIPMFKGVLTIVGAKADYAASVSERIASGEVDVEVLETALAYEWQALITILAISVLNVVLGVWRPNIKRRRNSGRADTGSTRIGMERQRERDRLAAAEKARSAPEN